MGEKITLTISERTVYGRKVRALRQSGITPGVIYGHGMEPLAIQADAGEVRHVVAVAGRHTPVSVQGAKRRIALIKDIEYDPTKKGVVRHISLHAVKADEPVNAEVPIHLVGIGESDAEKVGLVILQAIDKAVVRALPMDLPDAITVDITAMAAAGDKVTLGDAVLPKGVEFVDHDTGRADDDDDEKPSPLDLVVASAYEPAALEAANDTAAGDADATVVDDTETTREAAESVTE